MIAEQVEGCVLGIMIGEEHWQASFSSGEKKAKSEFRRFVIVKLLLDKRVCWVPIERTGCCGSPPASPGVRMPLSEALELSYDAA
eukprot:5430297-Pleurochrysis_carterae.AAC.2